MFKKLSAALLLCALLLPAAAWGAVPRGMVLGELMRVLDLPISTGKSFGDVSADTPYAQALQSALSLGILYPADDFEPDIPCTNAETLMFAVLAMGFRHEADTALWAVPRRDTKELPAHVAGCVSVARTMSPAAPKSLTSDPWGTTTEDQLAAVLKWAAQCRSSVAWDWEIKRPEGTLCLHRENVGRPPHGWRVQVGVFHTRAEAQSVARRRSRPDCPFGVEPVDSGFAVLSPRFASRSEAWQASCRLKLRDFSAVIQPDDGDSAALFWAMFTPAKTGDVRVRLCREDGEKPLARLSDIASRGGALAAMNGGYFGGAGPLGTVVVRGLPVTSPTGNRSMTSWTTGGNLHFGGGEYRALLSVNDAPPAPVTVNAPVDYGAAGVFTPPLGRPGTNGIVARVKDGRIAEVESALILNKTPRDGEWLIVSRDSAQTLRQGDRASLRTQWREKQPFAPDYAMQAGPLLYAPRYIPWDEHISLSVLDQRHPRTLLGEAGRRMVWLVVDGRSSWHSRGLTLAEAATLGRALGLKTLLNLDGGGSTEMIFEGHIVNRLSDGRERSMPHALIVPRAAEE